MIRSLRIDGLLEGQIPHYELPPPSRADVPDHLLVLYSAQEPHGVTAALQRRDQHLHIPIHAILRAADVAAYVEDLVRKAATFGWTQATLLVPTREPFQIEGDRLVPTGFALLEGQDAVGDAEPITNTEEAILLVQQWYQGIIGFDIAEMHPVLRNALSRLMWLREDASARWLADEPVRLAAAEKRQEAARKAKDLLYLCLNPTQQSQFDQDGCFEVNTPQVGTVRIEGRHAYNILLLDPVTREPIIAFCAVTSVFVPIYDQMLAQKLLFEADPVTFLRLANRRTLQDHVHWREVLDNLERHENIMQQFADQVQVDDPPA